jgi:hypothetical protein
MFNFKNVGLCLFIVLFCQSAHAKAFYKGKEIQEVHYNGIKGFLYESIMGAPPNVKDRLIVKFARACSWLGDIRNTPETFTLEEMDTEDSKLIIQSIEHIVKILGNNDPIFKVKDLIRWTGLGQFVLADYKESTTYNDDTKEFVIRINWKLEIKKPQFPVNIEHLF